MDAGSFQQSATAEFWSLSTAIAWVVSRSFEDVEKIAPGGVFDVGELVENGEEVLDAIHWLKQRLAAGVIKATGISERYEGERVEISQEGWLVAEMPFHITDTTATHFVRRLRVGNRLEENYRDIRLRKDNVLQWFPVRTPFIDQAADVLTRTAAEIAESDDMPMGEAVLWILSRGETVTVANYSAASSVAERELFEKIHKTKLEITGVIRPGASRSVALPDGIWKRMNKGQDGDGVFVGMDREHGEIGGTVYWDGKEWAEVCISSAFVLEHWPPADAEKRMPLSTEPVLGDPALVGDRDEAYEPTSLNPSPNLHTAGSKDFASEQVSSAEPQKPVERKKKASARLEQISAVAEILWPDGHSPAAPVDFKKVVSQYIKDNRPGEAVPSNSTFDRYFRERGTK